jgi:hypothetical protein
MAMANEEMTVAIEEFLVATVIQAGVMAPISEEIVILALDLSVYADTTDHIAPIGLNTQLTRMGIDPHASWLAVSEETPRDLIPRHLPHSAAPGRFLSRLVDCCIPCSYPPSLSSLSS